MVTYTRLLEFFMENNVKLTKDQLKALQEEFREDVELTNLQEVTLLKPSGSPYKIGIGIYKSLQDTNFDKAPYIKVFYGKDPDSSSKLARIDLKDISYIIHYKDSSKIEKWELSKKDKEALNKIFDSVDPKKGITYWESTIEALAFACNKPISYYEKMFPDGRPDFTKLK